MRRIRTPYYGWTVVGVLCAFGAVGVGLAGANFALFIGPMSDELGWSASTFGWAIYLRLAMILAAGPVIGRILDLRGPRLPVLTATLVRRRSRCGSRASATCGSCCSRSP